MIINVYDNKDFINYMLHTCLDARKMKTLIPDALASSKAWNKWSVNLPQASFLPQQRWQLKSWHVQYTLTSKRTLLYEINAVHVAGVCQNSSLI